MSQPLGYGDARSARASEAAFSASVAVVGNEDGAHKITADLMQGLNDMGFTIPAQGGTYWNDEAMGSRDYNDLEETPEAVASTNATLAENAAHLARLLKEAPYS